jgi:integrase
MSERFNFTKTALTALPAAPARQRVTFYDTKTPKLALRTTAAGTKTFYVVKRVGASMVWVKLGKFPDMTVEQARDEAAKALGEFATGENPAAIKRALKVEPTFSEAMADFLEGKRKRDGTPIAPKTKRDYSDLVRLHFGPLAKRKLSAIERTDVKALHTKLTKAGKLGQADKCVALVSSVFMYMLDTEQYSGTNPAERVKKNPPVQRDRFIQPDELPRFFEALVGMPNPTMRDFFLLALLTGARRANVCSMRWVDLDIQSGVWRIAMTKNGTPQNVTLSPEAVVVLEGRERACEWVFPGDGATGHIVEPKKAWAALLKAAGLENLRFHDLRRTLGSWQARTGASLPIIGKSLNHKTHQATAIYARLDLDPVRQSVNTATSAMMEAAGLKEPAVVLPLRKQA